MELNAICDVPQVEDHKKPHEYATVLLDKKDYPKYQRKLDRYRMKEISDFWVNYDHVFTNAITFPSSV